MQLSPTLLARSQAAPIVIHTAGRLEIHLAGVPLEYSGRAPLKPLALLGCLIASGSHGAGAGTVADLLWPEADGFDAYRALITTTHRLRRLLCNPKALRFSAGALRLDAQLCSVDVWVFESVLRNAHDGNELRAALQLYRGPFLGDDASPWAIAMRRRLETLQARTERELLSRRATHASNSVRSITTLPADLELVT